jgi:hypothetical protein
VRGGLTFEGSDQDKVPRRTLVRRGTFLFDYFDCRCRSKVASGPSSRRPVGLLREVGSELRRDVLGQRHEAVASRKRRHVQRVDRFEFAVVGAEPENEVVAALVGERLQEEGAQGGS